MFAVPVTVTPVACTFTAAASLLLLLSACRRIASPDTRRLLAVVVFPPPLFDKMAPPSVVRLPTVHSPAVMSVVTPDTAPARVMPAFRLSMPFVVAFCCMSAVPVTVSVSVVTDPVIVTPVGCTCKEAAPDSVCASILVPCWLTVTMLPTPCRTSAPPSIVARPDALSVVTPDTAPAFTTPAFRLLIP